MAKISCSGCGGNQNFYKGVAYCAYCGRQYAGEQIAFGEVKYVREKFVSNWYAIIMVLGVIVLTFGEGYLARAMRVFSSELTFFILAVGTAAYVIISWFVIKYIAKIRTPKLLDRQHTR